MEQQHYKRYKGSHKEFYRWVVNEIEDFVPPVLSENPLKSLDHLLKIDDSISLPIPERKKLVIAPPPKAEPILELGSNLSLCAYWQQFPRKLTEKLIELLDLKDIVALMNTCKYFTETLDQESMWKFLQSRDISFQRLERSGDVTISEKLYYKYLYFSTISGIPYHSGYFKAYGCRSVVELSDSIVDFLCPRTEVIKKYAGEILMRNQCKTFDFKLSWLKEKREICLWNFNRFSLGFIKRYSMVDEDEEIVEAFFLEDKYLVVKLFKKLEEGERTMTIFRILNLEEEFYSIVNEDDSAIPFDYSFMINKGSDDIETSEFGVDFVIDQETECDIKVKLLLNDIVVFYTENSIKPKIIFWDLKEKKKIDSVSLRLQKPLHAIIISKKSTLKEKIRLFLLDEDMNVYCGTLSKTEGFLQKQTIIIPISVQEEGVEKSKEENVDPELEAKIYLNLGKKTRSKHVRNNRYEYLFDAPPHYSLQQLDDQFSKNSRRYYHEILNGNEEWLIIHKKNNFYFINLDEEKIQEFSFGKDIGILISGNWTIYEDNLLISNPKNILYYKINFEDHSIRFVFSREFQHLSVRNIAQQWVVIDPCFTVLIFTHIYQLGFTTRVTIVVTSTQEFFYNQDSAYNLISYQVEAEQFIRPPDRLEQKDREVGIKFENSKILVSTDKSSFYFDMMVSAQPSSKLHPNGWSSKYSIQTIRYEKLVTVKANNQIEAEIEEIKPPKQKMVNYLKLGENKNNVNATEKNKGWRKSNGKNKAKKEEDKEYKVLKAKGDKYHKNIRKGQRSEKVN